jgi:hypothetical protein
LSLYSSYNTIDAIFSTCMNTGEGDRCRSWPRSLSQAVAWSVRDRFCQDPLYNGRDSRSSPREEMVGERSRVRARLRDRELSGEPIGQTTLPSTEWGLFVVVLCCAFALLLTITGCMAAALEPVGDGLRGTHEIDLDADGALENVELGRGSGGINIVDGDVSYRSRPKWSVVAADLGDTDHNGLPEVVALLDGPDGRHLALIGWHAGRYHERLVSSALRPTPTGMTVHFVAALGGDAIDLQLGGRLGERTYRWNGFGFTDVGNSE